MVSLLQKGALVLWSLQHSIHSAPLPLAHLYRTPAELPIPVVAEQRSSTRPSGHEVYRLRGPEQDRQARVEHTNPSQAQRMRSWAVPAQVGLGQAEEVWQSSCISGPHPALETLGTLRPVAEGWAGLADARSFGVGGVLALLPVDT